MAVVLRFGGQRLRFGGDNLMWSGATPLALIVKIKTDNVGVSDSNSFTIPVRGAYIYNYIVDWGGGVINTNVTGSITHTYDTAGEKTIKIYGLFPQFYFNNGGDMLKVLSVESWGNVEYPAVDMRESFYGCLNLSHIADGASWFDNLTNGIYMFRATQLTSLPDGMTLDNLTSGNEMFWSTQLTSLPDGMVLNNLTNGIYMFRATQLTSLPDGMTLNNLTSGNGMFWSTQLTSLPDGMVLDNLTNGTSMFRATQLTSLPDGMVLGNLTNGDSMFRQINLTSLPGGMTLDNLTSGNNMFQSTPLTSLPEGMTLDNLTNGDSMFRITQLTSLPEGIKFSSLTDGTNMFTGTTINTERYSQLLIDMEANNLNSDVPFHGGNSKYNSSAVTARANLVARGWTITDGGLA